MAASNLPACCRAIASLRRSCGDCALWAPQAPAHKSAKANRYIDLADASIIPETTTKNRKTIRFPAEEQYMRIDCPSCRCSDVNRRHRRGLFDNIRAYFDRWPYRCRNCDTCFYAKQRYQQRDAGRDERMREPAVGGESSAGPQMVFRSDPI